MVYELSLKNRRIRTWLWIMIPAFILTFSLFVYLPKEFNFLPVLPLIIGYLSYLGWASVQNRKQK